MKLVKSTMIQNFNIFTICCLFVQEFEPKRNRGLNHRSLSPDEEEERPVDSGSKKSDVEMELLSKPSSLREKKTENKSVSASARMNNFVCPRTQLIKRRREKSTIILVSVVLVRMLGQLYLVKQKMLDVILDDAIIRLM